MYTLTRQIELWVWPDPSLWKLKVPFICNINHASSGETESTMYEFAYFVLIFYTNKYSFKKAFSYELLLIPYQELVIWKRK